VHRQESDKVSENNPIRLFVTHAFEATPDFLRVFEYLEHASRFFYINHADTENMPPGDMKAITDALREQLRPAEAIIAQCATSRDHAEGTRAFLEKRRPVFTGS
jgi:enoyl-CoA hydratase/carnithine racemase